MVQDLYAKYPDVDALAEATPEEIEAIVRPCGLGKSKARDISACMKMLRDEYDGKVPCDFDAILKLPGVGRKSANLIMGDVFGHGYALHSSDKPYRSGRWDQRSEKSRNGTLEDHSTGRR